MYKIHEINYFTNKKTKKMEQKEITPSVESLVYFADNALDQNDRRKAQYDLISCDPQKGIKYATQGASIDIATLAFNEFINKMPQFDLEQSELIKIFQDIVLSGKTATLRNRAMYALLIMYSCKECNKEGMKNALLEITKHTQCDVIAEKCLFYSKDFFRSSSNDDVEKFLKETKNIFMQNYLRGVLAGKYN